MVVGGSSQYAYVATFPGVEPRSQLALGLELRKLLALNVQPFADAGVDAARDRSEYRIDGLRRMAYDTLRQAACCGHQRCAMDNLIDQYQFERPLRAQRIAGQQAFQRALTSGQPGQTLCAAERRRHAQAYLGFGEFNVFRSHCEMRCFDNVTTATLGQTVNRSDDWFGERLDARGHGLTSAYERTNHDGCAAANAVREFMNVTARGEGFFPCAGENDRAHGGIGFECIRHLSQRIGEGIVDGVEFLRPVRCHSRNTARNVVGL